MSSVFAQSAPKTQALAAQPGQRILSGTRTGIFATIQGNALDASSAPLDAAIVRLRDARFGKVSSNQVTDKAGLFGFPPVDPGSYVVELIDRSNVVLATSELLTVGPGDTASAVVKLPSRIQTFGGLFSHGVQQALAVTAAAAAAGVLVQSTTGVDASPR